MRKKLKFYTILTVLLLITTIVATDMVTNNSDIFVSYSEHSEAKNNIPVFLPKPEAGVVNNEDLVSVTRTPDDVGNNKKTQAEDVVFIPNDKPVYRNEDEYLENEPVKVTDMMNNRKNGVVRGESAVSESAKEDIVFISGKNNDNAEKNDKKNKHDNSYTKTKDKGIKTKRLDCSKLDCDHTVNSVCGGKVDDKKWKYRLFLNECFFRKVNCAFKYPNNRYKVVDMIKCNHIGSHANRTPGLPPVQASFDIDVEETRRSFSSRRSLNSYTNGQSCAHHCPVTCTEKYEPQCAVSSSGQRHTFLNHCKLDYNSCLNKVVWRIRPLSECVGGKKADIQQNRGFIAWMQKVGIVDNRGRLTLSKGPRPR